MQAVNDKNQMCFVVWSDEVEGRLDPYFYNSEIKLFKRIFKNHFFERVIEDIYRYPTFYGFKYKSSGIPVIKGENIDDYGIINPNQQFSYVAPEIHKKFSRTHLKDGDLVFSVRGIIGKVGYYDGFSPEANISPNVIKIRIKKDYNSKFFWIYLNSTIGKKIIQSLSSGQVQKTITVSDIKKIPIPLPPLSIQNKIVKLMESAYKQKKEKEAEAKKLLNSIDDYVLNELGIKIPEIKDKMCFVVSSEEIKNNRIDPYYHLPNFKELENVIKNGKFKTVKLKDLLEKSYTENSKPKIGDKYILAINSKEGKIAEIGIFGQHLFKKGGGTKREIKSPSYKHFPESLLVSRINIQRGGCAIIDKEIGEIYSTNEFYSFKTNDNISIKFLHILVRSRIFLILINRDVSGQFGRFKEEQFLNLEIPLPPLPIQVKIAKEVKSRIETAKKLKEEAQKIIEKAKKEVEKIILSE